MERQPPVCLHVPSAGLARRRLPKEVLVLNLLRYAVSRLARDGAKCNHVKRKLRIDFGTGPERNLKPMPEEGVKAMPLLLLRDGKLWVTDQYRRRLTEQEYRATESQHDKESLCILQVSQVGYNDLLFKTLVPRKRLVKLRGVTGFSLRT